MEALADGSPLRFAPARLTRGPTRLGHGVESTRVEARAVRIDHGDYVAGLHVRPAGLELTWDFARRPRGAGDLVVALAAPAPTRATIDGLAMGALAVGHGTFIDAAGRRTHVPIGRTDTEVRWVVPEAVLEAAVYPAVLDPLIGPATPIDPERLTGPALEPGRDVSLAFDGTRWLAVWLDDDGGRIRFTTIDGTTGEVAPSVVLVQGNSSTPVFSPRIATSGAGFVLVWLEGPGGTGGQGTGLPRAARFTLTGALVGGQVPLNTSVNVSAPAIAWNPATSQYLVVFVRSNPVSNLVATWVDPGTGALTPQPLVGTGAKREAAVACGPSGCLVGWSSPGTLFAGADLFGERVGGPTGVSPTQFDLCTMPGDQREPAVAAHGMEFLVTWTDSRSATPDLYTAVLDAANQTVPLNGRVLTTPAAERGRSVSSCSMGTCNVAWVESGSGVGYTSFIPASGMAAVSTRISGPGVGANNPAIAGAANVLVAWEEPRNGRSTIVGWPAGRSVPGAPTVLNRSFATQRDVALASSPGAGVLALWSDTRSDDGDIVVRLLAADAGVSTGLAAEGAQRFPTAAWNGSAWVTLWGDEAGLWGARLAPNGSSVGPRTLLVDAGVVSSISIAQVAGGLHGTWVSNRTVFGAPLSVGAQGLVSLAAVQTLSPANQACDEAAVTSNGTEWVALFTCETPSQFSLRGARGTGAAVSASFLVDVSNRRFVSPSVAFGDGRYLVTWSRTNMTEDVEYRFVSAGLDAGPVVPLATNAASESMPAAAWSPWGFIVTWRERFSGLDSVKAARITSDGGVLPLPLALVGGRDLAPAPVACLAPGRCVVAANPVDLSTGVPRAFEQRLTNERPVARTGSVTLQPGASGPLPFGGTDPEGDPLQFIVSIQPVQGVVSGDRLIANATATGSDEVRYRVTDGVDVSEDAVINITYAADGGMGMGGGSAGGGAMGGGSAGGGAMGGGAAGGGAMGGGAAAGGDAMAGGGAALAGGPAGGDAADAGVPELATVRFAPATCGCASIDGAWGLLLLGWLLPRRRR